MSHHLDSPTSRRDPRLNLTDVYVFDGVAGTAFVLVTNSSLAGAGRTAGFHPEGRYEVKVHFDAELAEALTYRFVFGGVDEGGQQDLSVVRLEGPDAARDDADGTVIARGRTSEVVNGEQDAVRVWAGPSADPFYLDLHHLGHILGGLQDRERIDFGGWTTDAAASSFTGSQVYSIVLEVPSSDPRLTTGRDIGVWGVTKLATDAGGWRQINRAAIPMMWPLFRAIGGDDESAEYQRATAAHPSEDRINDEAQVTDLIVAAAGFSGTTNAKAYGQLVAERLLPDLVPYRVGTPAAFSFAGFNGRSLADNAPEVMYALVTNSAVPTGLRAGDAAETRQDDFPYVVPRPEAD